MAVITAAGEETTIGTAVRGGGRAIARRAEERTTAGRGLDGMGRRIGYGCVFFGLVWASLLVGCSGGKYMEMYDLPREGWGREEAVVFYFEPDSAAGARGGQWIDISIRYDDDYPYAALPLVIKAVTPDKRFWADTVEFALRRPAADGEPGEGAYRRAGRHYSNHNDITRRYRSGVRFSQRGEYALSVRQLTGTERIRGIRSIGVVVSGARPVRRR